MTSIRLRYTDPKGYSFSKVVDILGQIDSRDVLDDAGWEEITREARNFLIELGPQVTPRDQRADVAVDAELMPEPGQVSWVKKWKPIKNAWGLVHAVVLSFVRSDTLQHGMSEDEFKARIRTVLKTVPPEFVPLLKHLRIEDFDRKDRLEAIQEYADALVTAVTAYRVALLRALQQAAAAACSSADRVVLAAEQLANDLVAKEKK